MKQNTKTLLEESQNTINKIKCVVPLATRHLFCNMFPEYLKDGTKIPSARLNNLWYGKSTSKEFNEQLNQFLESNINGKPKQ